MTRSLTEVITDGGVAVVGTDTVYGVCVDAANAAAVERLLALKRRPQGKPAAVSFEAVEDALVALPELGERTRAAVVALLPGPLTLLVPNPRKRFPLAGGELLGMRVLALGAGRPLLLTSANLAGGPEARTLEEVDPQLRAGADLVLDGGQLPGTPSTVVDLSALERGGHWRVVRDGAFSGEQLERALLGSRL
ncbi:MAG TPA: L-threonylcarbamoyladenylate synthase [Solirubrobacteraceae bacterium]|nr:L-threonylcarbamoyladenylate synthase [Solirubrobacteraceae bacterium]